jgi:UDP-N-acetylglucosamine 2-epimerase (non-hydrolysing)
MAPVIVALKNSGWAVPYVVTTGQHEDVVAAPLQLFGVRPNHNLSIERESGSLNELFGKALLALDAVIERIRPDCLIAQGDTTSVAAASIAAFQRRLPFIHLEAGLRTGIIDEPFPEEMNRRIASLCASLHCAPTELAYANLVAEGIDKANCVITGNTVIDALLHVANADPGTPAKFPSAPKVILATAHRRENFGAPLEKSLKGLRTAIDAFPDLALFFVAHPNPRAHRPVYRLLADHPRIVVTESLDYASLVAALKRSWAVVTDSGGLQEEAPALGKPVLVLRDVTERPEAVSAGAVRIIGSESRDVFEAISELYEDEGLYARMSVPLFPYGDGHAAERVVTAIRRFLRRHERDAPSREIDRRDPARAKT